MTACDLQFVTRLIDLMVPPTADNHTWARHANAPATVDYRVDTRPFRDKKLAAIAAHRSQLVDEDPRSFLLPGLVEPLLDEECFAHASGPALTAPLSALLGGA